MHAFFRSRLRPATALAGALLLAVLATASPATAVPPYFTFQVTLGDNCLSGTGPNNDNVVLLLRDHDGFVKDRVKATTNGTGSLDLERCFNAAIDIGDSIRATDGVTSHTRTFVLPHLGAGIDRATNVVSGVGPANEQVQVSACLAIAYDDCNPVGPYTAPVNANGRWSYDFSPKNIRGGDYVTLVWSNAANDSVRRELTTPYVAVFLGGNSFIGVAPRAALVDMSIRDKTGKLKSTAQATAAPLFGTSIIFFGEWRKQGFPVNVRVGDKIDGTYATDGQIPVPNLTTSPNAGMDRISGHCFANAFFEVRAQHADGSDSATHDGKTGANGNFNVDITVDNPTYDVRADDVISLTCRDGRGDAVGNSLYGLLIATLSQRAVRAVDGHRTPK